MPRRRRKFDGAFKARVALDTIRGLNTARELASIHKGHPTQITLWKKQLLEGAVSVFGASEQTKLFRKHSENKLLCFLPA